MSCDMKFSDTALVKFLNHLRIISDFYILHYVYSLHKVLPSHIGGLPIGAAQYSKP